MKKVLLVILVAISCCFGLLVTNLFRTNEANRVNTMEVTADATPFYIRESSKTSQELLTYFEKLSRKYQISIVKTDDNLMVVKSGVFDTSTFPKENFGISSLNFHQHPDGYYTNEAASERIGIIPVFLNAKKIRLQQLSTYFKDSTNSITGNYTITSTSSYPKDKVLNDLAHFLGVSVKELTSQRVFSQVGYVNQDLIITTVILAVLALVLVLGIFFYPLTQLKAIGVMKSLGYTNISILLDYIKPQMLTLIGTNLIIDIVVLCLKARPQYYIMTLLQSQLLLLLIYLLLTVFVFSLFQSITVSAMLRGFNGYKVGEYVGYVLKLMMVGLVAVMSFVAVPTFRDLKSAQERQTILYKNASDLVTIETFKLGNKLNNAFFSNQAEVNSYFIRLYKALEKEAGAYYIRHDKILEGKQAILSVNQNYLNNLGLSVSANHSVGRVFLVPRSLKSREEELKRALSRYVVTLLPYDKQAGADIPITIHYYSGEKQSLSFGDDMTKPVVNPIFLLVGDNLSFEEASYLTTTGLNNPLKLKKTSHNLKVAEQQTTEIMQDGTIIKLSSLPAIAQTYTSSLEDGLKNLSALALIFVLLNVIVSYLLAAIILICKHQYLNTTRLLGWKLRDRYRLLFSLLMIAYSLPLLILMLLHADWRVFTLFGAYALGDLALMILLIIRKERKQLSDNLKRGEL